MNVGFNLNERILHILLLKSERLSNLGLLSGKMGISLFFIHYFIKTKQSVFEDYAFELLDKITDEINQYTPLGMDSGLAGIGWGIEYILQNKYAEGEELDICEAIDNKIMQIDPRRIKDLSLETGLEGLLHYILIHLQEAILKSTALPFDITYLKDMYTAVCAIAPNKINEQMNYLINSYKTFFEKQESVHYNADLSAFIEKIEVDDVNLKTVPLVLKNGLAGYMLNSIL